MRRACLKAARALAVAGLLTLPHIVLAAQQDPKQIGQIAGHNPTTPAMACLGALRVELAWLADPTTFPYPLQARTTSAGLEVCGFVPDNATKIIALRLAGEHSGLSVVDEIALDSSLPAKRPAENSAALQAAAVNALKGCRFLTDLKLHIIPGGRVEIYGSVHSIEEMRTVSRALVAVPGCTSVDNRLKVIPVQRQGKVMTQVTADGSLCLQGTVHFHVYDVSANVVTERSPEPALAPVPTPDRPSLPAGPAVEPPSEEWIDTNTPGKSPSSLVNPAITRPESFVGMIPYPRFSALDHIESGSAQAEAWGGGNTGFASNEYSGSQKAQSEQTQFASSKGQNDDLAVTNQAAESSEFAAASNQSSLQRVTSLTPASGDPIHPSTANPGSAAAAAAALRPPAPRVTPMTPDGQWPSAFVGGQAKKIPTEFSAPVVNTGRPVAAATSRDSGVTVLRSPTWRAQLPSPILLAQLRDQIQNVGGRTVQNVDLRYQEDKTVILAVSLSDPSSAKMVADRVLEIDGLTESGVGVEIVKKK